VAVSARGTRAFSHTGPSSSRGRRGGDAGARSNSRRRRSNSESSVASCRCRCSASYCPACAFCTTGAAALHNSITALAQTHPTFAHQVMKPARHSHLRVLKHFAAAFRGSSSVDGWTAAIFPLRSSLARGVHSLLTRSNPNGGSADEKTRYFGRSRKPPGSPGLRRHRHRYQHHQRLCSRARVQHQQRHRHHQGRPSSRHGRRAR
jgi:hypothetical protein